MKRFSIYLLIVMSGLLDFGCKKFLDIQSIDKLTGNNFFQSKADVEANIYSLYSRMYAKYNTGAFISAMGEYRTGETVASIEGTQYTYRNQVMTYLQKNDLINAISGPNNSSWNSTYNLSQLTQWKEWYRVIQASNLLIQKLNDGIPGVSDADKDKYIAEATFVRCYCYFVIVRLYGDVPYYTDAYQYDPLPRVNMVTVMKNCIADLRAHKDVLPWTFQDPALKGVRASRGAAIALLMNMNMWNAGFDKANATSYWQATADLGDELIKSNSYKLLPMESWNDVVRGRSDENIFSFYISSNYGDAKAALVGFAESVLHYPYRKPESSNKFSPLHYRADYMQKLYSPSVADKRKDLWFEDMYSNNGDFQMLKFTKKGSETTANSTLEYSLLIFRYAESILLRAEALADLGKDAEAVIELDKVRARAGTALYGNGPGGDALKTAIFMERTKELQGESHHYFDLVRTGRIMEANYTYNVLTQDQFDRGAWTWPIDASALSNNPYMSLNAYWVNGGR